MKIINASVFQANGTFIKQDLHTFGSFLAQSSEDQKIFDAKGLYAIPGLIDIHFHGCVGYDFCNGTEEALSTMAEYEAKNGVLAICPTTVTQSKDALAKVCKVAAAYQDKPACADFIGINMEGPFISPNKKGAQNPEFIHRPDVDFFQELQKISGNKIKILDFAPEIDGAMELITELKDEVILSLAHTTADYDTASKAIVAGVKHVTHLYNAMPAFAHRSPGVIGAAFDDPACRVELIADGVHVHPSVVRATFKMFGDDRILLISDSIAATGMPDGDYDLGGLAIRVKGNRSILREGGAIAGSATNLMQCVQVAVKEMGIPLASAVKCASVNPAKELGIFNQYGSLDQGKFANVLLLDNELNIKYIIHKGEVIS